MRKLNNPFIEKKEIYNCFGCSPFNENGLQMEFYEDGDEVVSIWEPKEKFSGFVNVLHGGIQSTIIDEIAGWTVFVKLQTAGVTSDIEVSYKKPVLINQGKLTIRAKVLEVNERIAEIGVEIYNSKEKLCTTGKVYFYLFNKENAQKKFYYPGDGKF